MQPRLLEPADLPEGIAAVLAGRDVVAPVPEPRQLPSLRVAEPVTETEAGVMVATSGSTGEAKAVVLSASALAFAADATHERLGGPGDWVCVLPVNHVAGLMTVVRAVRAGTTIRFARGDLADLPEPGGRGYLSVVAAQLDRALAASETTARLRDYAAVLVGGGALPAGLRERATAAGVNVVATYGMSETCGGCVYDGEPLPGVRVELDGERIVLGGRMVFSGYRGRPDLTAAVLDGDRVRTADRGRWGSGRLQVLGRLDDVVISGGENVDLSHAQRLADAQFGAGGLVLLAVPDDRWGHRVVALTTAGITLEEVRTRLAPELGTAATPKELRRVPQLAYTSIGKLDRTALQQAWWEAGTDGDAG